MGERTMTLILPAKMVPDHRRVRKPAGMKPYVVRRELPVYGLPEGTPRPDLSGCVVLCDPAGGGLTVVPDTTKLAVDGEPLELLALIKDTLTASEQMELP